MSSVWGDELEHDKKNLSGICCLNTGKLFAAIWKLTAASQLTVQLQGSKESMCKAPP